MKKEKKILYIVILIGITILLSLPIVSNKFNCYIGEGINYISKSYELSKIGVFSNIIPSFANNFGYINSIFNNRFPDILLAITNLAFKNPIASFKLLEVITLFISGITMYCLVKEISENRNIGILAAGIYMMLP